MSNSRIYHGAKPFGHDSTVFELNCETKRIYAVGVERVTRVKRDNAHISVILEALAEAGMTIERLALSFGPDNEYQALRETIRLELGLFESALRDIWRDTKLTEEQMLDKARRLHGADAAARLQDWFAIEALLNFNHAKYMRISYDTWLEIHRRRIATHHPLQELVGFDHHTTHAFGALLHSPFEECAIVTLDGMGNNCFSKVFLASGTTLTEVGASNLLWTWGYLYAMATKVLGWYINCDEGKVEALASFAPPDQNFLKTLLDGYTISDRLEIIGLPDVLGPLWSTESLARLASELGREPFAATIQAFLEHKALEYVRKVIRVTGQKKLVFAGGIVGNVKMNQVLFEQSGLEQMYVAPAMNDSGSAQGAAYLLARQHGESLNFVRELEMPYWGPAFSTAEVERAVLEKSSRIRVKTLRSDQEGLETLLGALTSGKVCALFQGRAEFGPRALGNRSILAAPGFGAEIRNKINRAIKRREWFQPFCPSILESERERLFATSYSNRHMTCAFTLRPEHIDAIGAIAHVDGTSRPQFVEERSNPFFFDLLTAVKEKTGYGVLLNTSFNLHGRAMVLTPQDAIDDLCDCGLEGLLMHPFWIERL